jgi:hypothetical protein
LKSPFDFCCGYDAQGENVEARPALRRTYNLDNFSMRSQRLVPWLAIAGFGLAATAFGQALICPPAASIGAHACETYHFHVAMYRPDSRTFQELYGINQFASQSACDRAREAAIKRNLATVERMRVKDQQYEPDRFGTCHCDMTIDRASANYLNELQRIGQVRSAEEIRQRVRERLLDNNVPTDSDAMRGLIPPPTASPLLGGAKMVPLPATAAIATVTNAAGDLKPTKTIESSAPLTASLDLPLVEIATADSPAPAPVPSTTQVTVTAPAPTTAPATAPATTTAPPATTIAAAQPVTPPAETTTPAPLPETKVVEPQPTQPAPAVESHEEAPQPADETAESFVTYETERIQNVLKASGAIADESIKSKIFEACMQRIQLLSNLRSLIQGSGARSRLATAARNIKTEEDRLALVGALFGSDMPPHWAPQDAKDVILDPKPELDTDTEKVLRDTGTRYTLAQKKRALYVLLAHSQPTEEQQLWLGSVIDGFLQ